MHHNRTSAHHTAKFPAAPGTITQKRKDAPVGHHWQGRHERFNPVHAGLAAALLLVTIMFMEPANAAGLTLSGYSGTSQLPPRSETASNTISRAMPFQWSHTDISTEPGSTAVGSVTLLWMSSLLLMLAASLWSCTIALACKSTRPVVTFSPRSC